MSIQISPDVETRIRDLVANGRIASEDEVVREAMGSLEIRLAPPVHAEASSVKAGSKLGPPPGWYPGCSRTAAGMLADSSTEEDDRILEEVYQERKRPTRRDM